MELEIISKVLEKTASNEEMEELLTWVEVSEENKKIFTDLKNSWALSAMTSFGVDEKSEPEKFNLLLKKIHKDQKSNKQIRQRFNRQLFYEIRKIAAIVIVTAGLSALVGYFAWHAPNNSLAMHQLRVPSGQQAELTLADGTKIWLNSKSTLTYPGTFSGSSREVVLEGEGYFEVSHNAKIPFIVKTSHLNVKVLGTSFNVTSYANDRNLKLTLVNGSISILGSTNKEEMVRLKPGELAVCEKSTMRISVDTVDTELYTSWRRGQFKFRNLSFEEIASRLSRNFNTQFVFLNKDMKELKYNGSFYNYESLDQILKIMKTNSPFTYKIKRDTVIIK